MISQTIRKFALAAAAAVLMTGGMQAASLDTFGWTRVAPLAGSFSVLMPGTAQYKATPINSPGVNLTMHSYMVDTGSCGYGVMYGDLPGASANSAATLGYVRDGNASGGRVVDDKDFTFNGYPGKAVTIEKDGFVVYNRIVIASNRVYQVMFTMRKADPLPESANTFIRSFRIGN